MVREALGVGWYKSVYGARSLAHVRAVNLERNFGTWLAYYTVLLEPFSN